MSFRYYSQLEANQLGVKGYVKNLIDGQVLIEAEEKYLINTLNGLSKDRLKH